MNANWEIKRPKTKKDGQGGEITTYETIGTVSAKILKDQDANSPNLGALHKDQIRALLKDVVGSGLASGWKLGSPDGDYLVQDFERVSMRNAIVVAKKEELDAL